MEAKAIGSHALSWKLRLAGTWRHRRTQNRIVALEKNKEKHNCSWKNIEKAQLPTAMERAETIQNSKTN
jgi:hypothetical protein